MVENDQEDDQRKPGLQMRLPSTKPAIKAPEWIQDGGKRPRGRPKKTWCSTVKKDLYERGTNWF